MVAVLFADVSGFTQMSEQLDAEQVHEVMNEVFAGLGRVIHDEGGHIDKYIGDNVMALFGAPVAHDDDPQRACRTALRMQSYLNELEDRKAIGSGKRLRMRIGVNFGSVVAGGVGSDVKRQYTVMGDAVNVASRLESSASPGSILVSESIFDHVNRSFRFGESKALQIKGKSQPIIAYELLGELEEEAQPQTFESPFIGREQVIKQLQESIELSWRQPDVRGRWIDVRGEMGIGKTRIVSELTKGMKVGIAHHVALSHASKRRPFGLVRLLAMTMLRNMTGFSDFSRDQFEKAMLSRSADLGPFVHALWYVMSNEVISGDAPDNDPAAMRRTVEAGFKAFFLDVFRRGKTVLVIDSFGLADRPSTDLIKDVLADAPDLPVAVLTIARNEPPSTECASVIRLDPLDETSSYRLLTALITNQVLSETTRAKIVRTGGGVPLFIEEIVALKSNQERIKAESEDRADGHFKSDPEEDLPTTLRAAMTSRLDQLPPRTRDLLCLSSILGREFDVTILEHVAIQGRFDQGDVRDDLESLSRLGHIEPSSADKWSFVRSAMQEVCYTTLLKRDRRIFHRQVADALCDISGGRSHVPASNLAEHEARAERWFFAAEANFRTGQSNAELFLNDQAIRRYEQALEQLKLNEETPDESCASLEHWIHIGISRVCLLIGDYQRAADAVLHVLKSTLDKKPVGQAKLLLARVRMRTRDVASARQLLESIVAIPSLDGNDDNTLCEAWLDLAEIHIRASELDEAYCCVQASRDQEHAEDRSITIHADLVEGVIMQTRGRFDDAVEVYTRAYRSAKDMGSLSQSARASNNLGNVERDRGDYVAARDYYLRALGIWEQIGDVECAAGAHNNLGNVAMSIGDFSQAEQQFCLSTSSWERIGNMRGEAMGHANLGILAVEQNQPDRGIARADKAIACLESDDDLHLWGLVMVVRGECMVMLDRLSEAREGFEAVINRCSEKDHPLAIAGAMRGLGHVAFQNSRLDLALTDLRQACDSFSQLRRVQESARTRLLIAQVLIKKKNAQEAQSEICMALEAFEDIGAMRDIQHARDLLTKLGGR